MKRLERLSYYEVEAIVDSKPDDLGNPLYLVKWKNWPPETNTWEPAKHLSTVKSLIRDFHSAQKAPQASAPPAEPVKRKRGRPRIIREPAASDAKPQANAPGKAERLVSVAEENTHPAIETPSEPAVKLEEGQNHRDRRKKPIRKLHRASKKPLALPFPQKKHAFIQGPSKAREADKEAVREGEREGVGEGEEGKERQQSGLQEVLLQCLNYTGVKVSFKDRTFYYQIPFLRDGRQQSLTVTAPEIIKVNQRWFEGFFEGFYM